MRHKHKPKQMGHQSFCTGTGTNTHTDLNLTHASVENMLQVLATPEQIPEKVVLTVVGNTFAEKNQNSFS